MTKTTLLHQAATEGDALAVQILTAQGARVNARNEDGSTPLHLAADNGHFEAVEILLERGAITNARDNTGRTPLQEAVYHGHASIVELLLKHGSKVNNQTNANSGNPGATALHEACSSGNEEIAFMLLARGANANLKTRGETPFHWAIKYNHNSIAAMLLRDTRDENIINAYKQASNKAPWHIALECGDWARAKQLLAELDDVNQPDKYGSFPLIVAIEQGHRGMVEFLLDRGAKTYIEDADDTPLGAAAFYDRIDIARLLLKRGAPVHGCDITNDMPLNRAVAGRNGRMVKLLLKHGANPSWFSSCPLQDAAANGDTASVRYLLEHGLEVNTANSFGTTPLHWAASGGHTETVRFLIKRGANINAKNEQGTTPLHDAALAAHENTVRLLLALGANVNTPNYDGETPLTYICQVPVPEHWITSFISGQAGVFPPPTEYYQERHTDGCYVRIAKMLLKRGAKINVRVKHSRATPLHLAVFHGDKKLVALLLRHGAKVNVRDADGQSPLAIANCCDHEEVVALLVQHGARNKNGRHLEKDAASTFDAVE